VAALANRVNSITGARYGDDPTIFALVSSFFLVWELAFGLQRERERKFSPFSLTFFSLSFLSPSKHPPPPPKKNLINEPRCRGCGTAIGDWATAVAPAVRKEWRQLLTIGAEGFFSDALDPQRAGANPGGRGSWAGSEGQSFLRDHAAMDFLSIHSEKSVPPPRLPSLPPPLLLLLLTFFLLFSPSQKTNSVARQLENARSRLCQEVARSAHRRRRGGEEAAAARRLLPSFPFVFAPSLLLSRSLTLPSPTPSK